MPGQCQCPKALIWAAAELTQDPEAGGFADRPGNMVDVYHTHFGLAGLSLLGVVDGLQEVDAV